MAGTDALGKKVDRLKKKLAQVRKGVSDKKDPEGSIALRTWHKRLKRAQRKKKKVDLILGKMAAKQAKKNKGEGAPEAKAEESAA
jgi:hypothetical protein